MPSKSCSCTAFWLLFFPPPSLYVKTLNMGCSSYHHRGQRAGKKHGRKKGAGKNALPPQSPPPPLLYACLFVGTFFCTHIILPTNRLGKKKDTSLKPWQVIDHMDSIPPEFSACNRQHLNHIVWTVCAAIRNQGMLYQTMARTCTQL
jgi:hypothetical protein